jgi:DNA-binding XRE family transcriptional regulator
MTSEQGMSTQTIHLEGKSYVVVPSDEYHRLVTLSKAADLPPLPEPDAKGNYPAIEYACASIARGIIRDRVAAGLTQKELAEMAGIREETLCRIETGKNIPSVPTIDKIDRALKQAAKDKQGGKRPTRTARKGNR